jgi:hypothetical protein
MLPLSSTRTGEPTGICSVVCAVPPCPLIGPVTAVSGMTSPIGVTKRTLTSLIGRLSASKTIALRVRPPPTSAPQVASLICASTVAMRTVAAPGVIENETSPLTAPADAVTLTVPGGAMPAGITICTCATPCSTLPSISTLRVVVTIGRRRPILGVKSKSRLTPLSGRLSWSKAKA